MKQIHDFLKQHNLKVDRYQKQRGVFFVRVNDTEYAIKENKIDKTDIYKYLNSRSFNYYPEVLNEHEAYEITKVINGIDYPEEQKLLDLIHLVALLHSKTTYYKEIEQDYFKKIYEDLSGNIKHLEEYYLDIITMIEKETFMSPSYYLLARNISIFFSSLSNAKELLEKWYDMVKDLTKTRVCVLHNNLRLDHFIKGENPYLLSWDHAKIDNPIFDLYKLYNAHAATYDFEYYLKEYEKKYPLLDYERILFCILISLPNKVSWNEEFATCKKFTEEIDLLYKKEKIITLYNK